MNELLKSFKEHFHLFRLGEDDDKLKMNGTAALVHECGNGEYMYWPAEFDLSEAGETASVGDFIAFDSEGYPYLFALGGELNRIYENFMCRKK